MQQRGLVNGAFAAILVLAGVAETGQSVGSRYLIYLHGRIIQESQSPRPRHSRYGYYELEKILDTFRSEGFIVIGEIRPKGTSVSEAADHVVAQVQELLESGVRADHITVVGGSMGGGIALLASARLQNRQIRFCTLGTCLAMNLRYLLAEENEGPSGFVLAIREASDEATSDCPAWPSESGVDSHLTAREIVVDTGLGHGFLYRPLPEWVEPVLQWANGEVASEVDEETVKRPEDEPRR
jgi:hypothetical protein